MSVVIAAKYKDGVAMISDKQVTGGNTKSDNAVKLKHFIYSNTALGAVGYLRDCNVIRTMEETVPYRDIVLKTEVDELFTISSVVPTIVNHMMANKRTIGNDSLITMNSVLLFATSKSIFQIGSDFSVVEQEGSFGTIGCGDDKIIGFMSTYGDTSNFSKKEIINLLTRAVVEGCAKDVYINDKYDIIFLENEIKTEYLKTTKLKLKNAY